MSEWASDGCGESGDGLPAAFDTSYIDVATTQSLHPVPMPAPMPMPMPVPMPMPMPMLMLTV